jgi:hypothetical protein
LEGVSSINLISPDPDNRIAEKGRLETEPRNENMLSLMRDMEKFERQIVVLVTGLEDIIPASKMMGDADEEEE